MTEVIPSPVNESHSGSLNATGAIIIIMAITYRSPPTSSGISVMLFFLLDDRQAAIPGLVELILFRPQSGSKAALVMGWSFIILVVLFSPSAFKMRVLRSYQGLL